MMIYSILQQIQATSNIFIGLIEATDNNKDSYQKQIQIADNIHTSKLHGAQNQQHIKNPQHNEHFQQASQQVDPEKDYIYWPFNDMPKFFPLVSLTFGYWASRLHMKDQMFLMIQKNKFIYVVVHPPKQPKTPKNQSRQFSKTFRENFNSSENHQTNNFFSTNSEKQQEFDKDSYYDSFYLLNKKKILKLFGNKNPFTTVTDMKGGRQDVDFYGVVTFEVEFKEIVGMGYVNNHMRGHNRIVLEARTIIKKSFENVEDFYGFYYPEGLADCEAEDDFYRPKINNLKQTIEINQSFPYNKKYKYPEANVTDSKTETRKQFKERFIQEQNLKSAYVKKSNILTQNKALKQTQQSMLLRPSKTLKLDLSSSLLSQSAQGNQAEVFDMNQSNQSVLLTDPQLQQSEHVSDANFTFNDCNQLTQGDQRYASNMRIDTFDYKQTNELQDLHEFFNTNIPLVESELLDLDIKQSKTPVKYTQKLIQIKDERVLKDLTIVAYYEDPILPHALRELLNQNDKQSKKMFLMTEIGIPHWTVVLAQFGYYKPWIRFLVKYLVTLMSILTMILGFWDLYKNVPFINTLIQTHLQSLYQFFEDHVIIRLSMLLGLILSKSTPFINFINWILRPGVFSLIVNLLLPLFDLLLLIINEVLYPFVQVLKLLKLTLILIYEIISPVFIFGYEIIKLKISLIKLLFYMPAMSILKILLLVRDCFVSVYIFVKEILTLISSVKRIILPAARSVAENREATFNIIQFFQQIGFAWSQSLYKKIVQGCKTFYDLLMFLLMPEIFRKVYIFFFDSLKKLRINLNRFFQYLKSKKYIFVAILKFIIRYVIIVLLVRILYIGIREIFKIEGCIFCTEFTDKTSHKVYKYMQSEEFLHMLNNFHNFVDWLMTIQTIDLVGIEM
eukprot:403362021